MGSVNRRKALVAGEMGDPSVARGRTKAHGPWTGDRDAGHGAFINIQNRGRR